MRLKEFEKNDIAEAAMKVFWQRGYAGTSIQDLVEGTGLGRGSLRVSLINSWSAYSDPALSTNSGVPKVLNAEVKRVPISSAFASSKGIP